MAYACIAGCAVRGNGRAPRRALPRYSFSAYSQVCGSGHLVEGATRPAVTQSPHQVAQWQTRGVCAAAPHTPRRMPPSPCTYSG